MTYRVHIAPRATRILRRMAQDVREKVIAESALVARDPHSAPLLSGGFAGMRCHHFTFRGTAYRMAFTVDQSTREISVILASPREGFYKQLRQAVRR